MYDLVGCSSLTNRQKDRQFQQAPVEQDEDLAGPVEQDEDLAGFVVVVVAVVVDWFGSCYFVAVVVVGHFDSCWVVAVVRCY